jgi:hypothetical protein
VLVNIEGIAYKVEPDEIYRKVHSCHIFFEIYIVDNKIIIVVYRPLFRYESEQLREINSRELKQQTEGIRSEKIWFYLDCNQGLPIFQLVLLTIHATIFTHARFFQDYPDFSGYFVRYYSE